MRTRLNLAASAVAAAATLGALAGLCTPALAQERGEHREREHVAEAWRRPALHLDERYHHDHYYPPHGTAYPVLPGGSLSIGFGGGNWFFHGGVWFRPIGGRFVVSVPPIGIVAPLLPADSTTLWIGGAPYYYANGVYYAQAPGQGYTVVAPPSGAEAAVPVPAAPVPRALPEPIVYPRNGQSAGQTEADRQDCGRWASGQANASADAQVHQRALTACMDGRGYTVR